MRGSRAREIRRLARLKLIIEGGLPADVVGVTREGRSMLGRASRFLRRAFKRALPCQRRPLSRLVRAEIRRLLRASP